MEAVVAQLREWQAAIDVFDFDQYPCNTYLWPAVASITYVTVIFLLRVNVTQKYKLKYITFVHNFFLCWLSLLMLLGCLVSLYRIAMHKGWIYIVFDRLDHEDGGNNIGSLMFWCYIFYVSKFYEMLDTVLMVLKGRPLTFIHMYHHMIVPYLFWSFMATDATAHWILVVNNSGVHVIMYFYYMIHTMGYTVWWKKYLTMLQIVQFFIDMMSTWPHIMTMFFITPAMSGETCYGTMPPVLFGQCVGLSFVYLFTSFYFTAYKKDASVLTQFQSVEEQMAAKAKEENK